MEIPKKRTLANPGLASSHSYHQDSLLTPLDCSALHSIPPVPLKLHTSLYSYLALYHHFHLSEEGCSCQDLVQMPTPPQIFQLQ